MEFSEKDLENILYGQILKEDSYESLSQRGIEQIDGHKHFRHLRIGNYGVANIVSLTKPFYDGEVKHHVDNPSIHLYELTIDEINSSTFFKAIGLAKGIKQYTFKRFGIKNIDFIITLIGREIDLSDELVYLPEILNSDSFHLELYTFTYDAFEGIQFKQHRNYRLSDESFKQTKSIAPKINVSFDNISPQ